MATLDVTHHNADLGAVMLHYVTAGKGDPVVLLHGWPQSWYEWRHVIPALAERHTVIAPDMRGLGDSSRPAGDYPKRVLAEDIHRLVRERLGHKRCFVVGHDWGGPVAFAFAALYPEAVRRLVILDVVIPGDGSETFSQGGRRWHHAFHQTLDLPEALIHGRERLYLSWFYRSFGHRPNVFSEADIDEYLRTYTQPGAMRAGLAYYRALPLDAEHNRELLKRGKIAMPVLALGGAKSWGRRLETLESLRRVAVNVRGGMIEECGHWIPEERPRALVDQLLAFFAEDAA